MRQISRYPEGQFLVAIVKRQLKQSERFSRTRLRYNHIEYPEMVLGPTFPQIQRYIPEEDLSVQEDAWRRNDQPIGQLDPLLPDALTRTGGASPPPRMFSSPAGYLSAGRVWNFRATERLRVLVNNIDILAGRRK